MKSAFYGVNCWLWGWKNVKIMRFFAVGNALKFNPRVSNIE